MLQKLFEIENENEKHISSFKSLALEICDLGNKLSVKTQIGG